MATYGYISNNELYHHGILGQKWGVRRYQNADGSLTAQGKARYGSGKIKSTIKRNINSNIETMNKVKNAAKRNVNSNIETMNKVKNAAKKNASDNINTLKSIPGKVKNLSPETKKKIVIGALAVIGTAAAVGGTVYAVKNPAVVSNILSKIGRTAVGAATSVANKVGQIKANRQMKIADKLSKAVAGTGNITKDAKIIGKYGSLDDVSNLLNDANRSRQLQSSLSATKSLAPKLRLLGDEGLKAITKATAMENASDKLNSMIRENYGLGRIGKTVAGATALTGSLVAGKKIFNDLNSVYSTKDLPVVKDYLNSANGQNAKKMVDNMNKTIFGESVDELNKKKG